MPLHVDAAASAALLAIEKGRAGMIYNIVESDAAAASDKARRELGWDRASALPTAQFRGS
jgi:nucleoside-diphosphate-sugar epimerase